MDELTETLRQAQRFGFFGAGPIEDAVGHSRQFVSALGSLRPGARLLDLGSGGGLPGLVLAAEYGEAEITLLDRRQKRTDFLERAVRRLEFDHVTVRCADVVELLDAVAADVLPRFDAVTARGFGPPEVTLRSAVALVRPAGRILISEPPTGDRWPPQLLDELAVWSIEHSGVREFRRSVTVDWSTSTGA